MSYFYFFSIGIYSSVPAIKSIASSVQKSIKLYEGYTTVEVSRSLCPRESDQSWFFVFSTFWKVSLPYK